MNEFPHGALLAVSAVQWTVLGIGVLSTLYFAIQLGHAAIAQFERPRGTRSILLWGSYADLAPPIAVVVPAFNEAVTIIDTVTSLLALYYPSVDIVVVNDGSDDETLSRLVEAYDLQPATYAYDLPLDHRPIRGIYSAPDLSRLLVVDKENGGKADALNAGVNVARAPLFCTVDADSLLENDALLRAVRPFIEEQTMVAVGGTVRIANGSRIEAGNVISVRLPRTFLGLVQTLEYLRSHLAARQALSRLNAVTVISGAFGLFSRAAVLEVGGYSANTVAEDMEIVVKLHRYMIEQKRPYRVAFIPEPVCWTEAPSDLRTLGRQRARWQRGAIETLFKHRRMLFNPRYGAPGVLGIGQIFVVDLLTPIFEVAGYVTIPLMWWAGLLSADFFWAYLGITFMYGVFMSVSALALEEVGQRRFPGVGSLLALTLTAVVENFGYRQINNLWRLHGIWQFLRGDRSWGRMDRQGFGSLRRDHQ